MEVTVQDAGGMPLRDAVRLCLGTFCATFPWEAKTAGGSRPDIFPGESNCAHRLCHQCQNSGWSGRNPGRNDMVRSMADLGWMTGPPREDRYRRFARQGWRKGVGWNPRQCCNDSIALNARWIVVEIISLTGYWYYCSWSNLNWMMWLEYLELIWNSWNSWFLQAKKLKKLLPSSYLNIVHKDDSLFKKETAAINPSTPVWTNMSKKS